MSYAAARAHFLIPSDALEAEPEIIRSYVVMELLKSLALDQPKTLAWFMYSRCFPWPGGRWKKEVNLPYSLLAGGGIQGEFPLAGVFCRKRTGERDACPRSE